MSRELDAPDLLLGSRGTAPRTAGIRATHPIPRARGPRLAGQGDEQETRSVPVPLEHPRQSIDQAIELAEAGLGSEVDPEEEGRAHRLDPVLDGPRPGDRGAPRLAGLVERAIVVVLESLVEAPGPIEPGARDEGARGVARAGQALGDRLVAIGQEVEPLIPDSVGLGSQAGEQRGRCARLAEGGGRGPGEAKPLGAEGTEAGRRLGWSAEAAQTIRGQSIHGHQDQTRAFLCLRHAGQADPDRPPCRPRTDEGAVEAPTSVVHGQGIAKKTCDVLRHVDSTA
jgi:hypothetical protein